MRQWKGRSFVIVVVRMGLTMNPKVLLTTKMMAGESRKDTYEYKREGGKKGSVESPGLDHEEEEERLETGFSCEPFFCRKKRGMNLLSNFYSRLSFSFVRLLRFFPEYQWCNLLLFSDSGFQASNDGRHKKHLMTQKITVTWNREIISIFYSEKTKKEGCISGKISQIKQMEWHSRKGSARNINKDLPKKNDQKSDFHLFPQLFGKSICVGLKVKRVYRTDARNKFLSREALLTNNIRTFHREAHIVLSLGRHQVNNISKEDAKQDKYWLMLEDLFVE